ncbi:hypothetical protein [Pseudomonas sp. LB3P31]
MQTPPGAVLKTSSSIFVEFETAEIIHSSRTTDEAARPLLTNPSNNETNDVTLDPMHAITQYSQLMDMHKAWIEQKYQTHCHQLSQSIEKELTATRMVGAIDTASLLDAINREIEVRNKLLARKNAEYREKIRIANLFYGSDPVDKSLADFYLKAAGMESDANSDGVAIKAWLTSYQAACDSRLIFQTIQMLSEQAIAVQNFLDAVRVDDLS